MNIKLDTDQYEALENLLDDKAGCKALLEQMNFLVTNTELQVLKNPVVIDEENSVIYDKLRAEGARTLYNQLKTVLRLTPNTK